MSLKIIDNISTESLIMIHDSLLEKIESERHISAELEQQLFENGYSVYGFKSVEKDSWAEHIKLLEDTMKLRNIPFEEINI